MEEVSEDGKTLGEERSVGRPLDTALEGVTTGIRRGKHLCDPEGQSLRGP